MDSLNTLIAIVKQIILPFHDGVVAAGARLSADISCRAKGQHTLPCGAGPNLQGFCYVFERRAVPILGPELLNDGERFFHCLCHAWNYTAIVK